MAMAVKRYLRFGGHTEKEKPWRRKVQKPFRLKGQLKRNNSNFHDNSR